ncbi:MAG TPA: aminotransferase class V-fold PLP-dependent enzyme [Solirubrobacterales bacterium]|jgi:lysine decarboxylase|nr:aminotransferase class V-fold PLP-dependent enzyme [Solirubrobacterales bacterium]
MPHAGQDSTPYVDALLAYAEHDPGRFQVPGHKGGAGADPKLRELVGEVGLRNDVPSVTEGVDIGPEPNPFQQAQLLAAEAWGAQRSWFLVNGASQGNHSTCLALAHGGDRVVVQRNVHSSVIDGLILSGMRPTFVAPEIDAELGIAHGLTPRALERALAETPSAVAALVVSPTYFGACADVAALAAMAHGRGVPLVVDEAWGAHLRFHPDLPPDALASGADLVVSSTHKIVGSLTQAAMLHLGGGGRLDPAVVDRCVSLVETTSPSGLLSGSLDAARRRAAVHGVELLGETLAAVAETRAAIGEIPGLAVLDESMVGRPGIAGWDPLRLSIDVRGTGSTGYRIAKSAFYDAGLDLELHSDNVVVAIFGLGEPAARAGQRLLAGLRQVVDKLEGERRAPEKLAPPPPWGELALTPREAFLGPQEVVPFDDAAGRIAAEGLAAYPPGIPNVLPGERLTAETLDYIRESVAHGGFVRGSSDRALRTLRVTR